MSGAAVARAIPVGVVHGSRLIAEGLRDLLGRETSVSVAGVHLDVAGAARAPIRGPHVLLADLGSVRAAGMAGVAALLAAAPDAKILVFDVEDDDAAIIECVRAGTAGCVLRDASPAELVAAIMSVANGTAPVSPRIVTSLFRFVAEHGVHGDSRPADLTPREEQILQLLAEGLSNKEIAGRLFLQPQTVKNYVHLVLQKLDLHSRLDVIRLLRSRRH